MPLSRAAAVAVTLVASTVGGFGLITVAADDPNVKGRPPACVSTMCDTNGVGSPPSVSGRWAHPLRPAPYVVTSVFGAWRPNLFLARLHKGQDLAAPMGTVVRAMCDGVVVRAGWDVYGGGTMTTLDCGAGITVKLMHQSAILTRAGTVVTAGQMIGTVGSTGNSTGPHLHVQVETLGAAIDPVPFMRARGVPL